MIHHNILFHQVTEVLKTFYPISPGFIIRLGALIDFAEYRAGDIILHYIIYVSKNETIFQ